MQFGRPRVRDSKEPLVLHSNLSKDLRRQRAAVEQAVFCYQSNTERLDRNLQRVKQQLLRDGTLSPEQIRYIEQKAAAETSKL